MATRNSNTAGGSQNNNSGDGSQFVSEEQNFFVGLSDYIPRFKKSPEQEREECLGSLSFCRMNYRHAEILPPFPNTCEWHFKSPKFRQWRRRRKNRSGGPILWIKGKPGAGKSTLMKHTLSHCEQKWTDRIIASYFCDARGDILEKSATGMLRALLHQIIVQDEDVYRLFLDLYRKKAAASGKEERWEWRECELRQFLRENLLHSGIIPGKFKSLLFIVDGLDECGEDEFRHAVHILEELSSHAASNGVILNICLASRAYPHISMRPSIVLQVDHDEGHEKDISLFIQKKLRVSNQEIEMEIKRKASGIFRWVDRVLLELWRAHDSGNVDPEALYRIVCDLPEDLGKVFDDMLTRGSPEDRRATVHMFQWLLFSMRPLTLEELYFAIKVGISPELLQPRDRSTIDENDMSRRITSLSMGLIEIRGDERKTVHLIHESLRDRLWDNGGLSDLDPDLKENVVGKSHDVLRRSCMAYLQTPEYPESANPGSVLDQYPLLEYATRYLLDHAVAAQSMKIAQDDLVSFLKSDWILQRVSGCQCMLRLLALAPSAAILSVWAFTGLIDIAVYYGGIVAINDRESYSTTLRAALMKHNTGWPEVLHGRMPTSRRGPFFMKRYWALTLFPLLVFYLFESGWDGY